MNTPGTKASLFVALLLCVVMISGPAHAQWQSFDRPCADFRALAVMDATIYAFGSPGALHKSTNNGLTWTLVKFPVPMDHPGLCLGVLDGKLLGGTVKGMFFSSFGWGTKQAVAGVEDDIRAVSIVKLGNQYKAFLGGFGGGVRRSVDSCRTWMLTNEGLTNLNVASLATSTAAGDTNPVLFAGTYGGGMFRSSNDGSHWTATNAGLDNLFVYAIAARGDSLYTAHSGGSVFQSIDMGATWAQLGTGLPHTDAISIAAVTLSGRMYLFAGTIDAGIWRYTPATDTWIAMNSGLKSLRINSIVSKDSLLFVATERGIHRSTDFGSSWQLTSESATPLVSTLFAASFTSGTPTTRLIVATDGHYYRSDLDYYPASAVCWTEDLGKTWNATPFLPQGISTRYRFEYFAAQHNDCIFLFNTSGGEYDSPRHMLSTDRGTTWGDQVWDPFKFSDPRGVILRGRASEHRFETYMVFLGGPNPGLWRSLDSAKTWNEVPPPSLLRYVTPPIFLQDSTLYGSYLSPFRTCDNGQTWTIIGYKGHYSIPEGSLSGDIMTIVHACDVAIFANVYANAAPGELGGLYASYDRGDSWMPAGFTGKTVERVIQSGGTLFAVMGGHVYASRMSTFLWKDVTGNLAPDSAVVITASAEYLFAVTKTSDRIWYRPVSEINAELGSVPLAPSLLAPLNGATHDTTHAILRWSPVDYTQSYRLQLSKDPAFSQVIVIDSINLLDTTLQAADLAKNQTYFWRVSGLNPNGYGPWSTTYHFTVSPTATNVAALDVPTETALLQNYPNPFNPVTKIAYTVGVVSLPAGQAGGQSPVASHRVRLVVYDLLGREVAVLVDEKKGEGNYEVKFDASRFSSGSYIYRLTTGDKVLARRMVVLR